MFPDLERMAIHQAGHAVAQTLVGRERFSVSRDRLGIDDNEAWRGFRARGGTALDRETRLSLYEFGLVTLAGIAAEERFLLGHPPEDDPLVALSDLAQWQEQARDVLGDEAHVRLVSLNVMRRLDGWFADRAIWSVVESLAGELLAAETVEGDVLRAILARLREGDQV